MQNLTTERLIFNKIRRTDAAVLAKILNEPGYLVHIGDRGIRTAEQAERYISENFGYEHEGYGFYLMRLREGHEVVGFAGIVKRDFLEVPDIEYALLQEYEGNGYAASAALAHAKNNLSLTEVGAITSQENDASRAVLTRIGMTFVRLVDYPGEKDPVALFMIRIQASDR